jgi:hypothetical protein
VKPSQNLLGDSWSKAERQKEKESGEERKKHLEKRIE